MACAAETTGCKKEGYKRAGPGEKGQREVLCFLKCDHLLL